MNKKVKNLKTEILSNNWYTLKKITYDFLSNGEWKTLNREAYDRGNGAVILLYNKETKTVILTRQFRLPTYINGNADGMLIEACAGLLDKDNAEDCIKRETEEETGYKITHVQKIFEAYMSPGSVTEILYFFIAEYSKGSKFSGNRVNIYGAQNSCLLSSMKVPPNESIDDSSSQNLLSELSVFQYSLNSFIPPPPPKPFCMPGSRIVKMNLLFLCFAASISLFLNIKND